VGIVASQAMGGGFDSHLRYAGTALRTNTPHRWSWTGRRAKVGNGQTWSPACAFLQHLAALQGRCTEPDLRSGGLSLCDVDRVVINGG
jgi:hypothetical protein